MKTQFNRFIAPTRPQKISESKEEICVVLLSGAIPYGMKSYGTKSLLNTIGGTTLIEHQIKTIKNVYPNSEIITVIGYEADKIIKKKLSCRLIENQLFEDTGETEQLRLAINSSYKKNFLVINGDVYFNELSISNDLSQNFLLTSDKDKNKSEIGATIVDSHVTYLDYTMKNNKWCNICFFNEKCYSNLYAYLFNRDNNRQYIFNLINHLMFKDIAFKNYSNEQSKAVKIDKSEDIQELLKK